MTVLGYSKNSLQINLDGDILFLYFLKMQHERRIFLIIHTFYRKVTEFVLKWTVGKHLKK